MMSSAPDHLNKIPLRRAHVPKKKKHVPQSLARSQSTPFLDIATFKKTQTDNIYYILMDCDGYMGMIILLCFTI